MAKEPERITLQHILVSFAGAQTEATRPKAEAETLAKQVLERLTKGEDFTVIMKQLSDDPGPGVYSLANRGVRQQSREEYPRDGMVPAFGNVGFALEVDAVGLAPFHPSASPFGWHIIKRLK
jgi:parvulin-like peptidyl-prolyl isomerase